MSERVDQSLRPTADLLLEVVKAREVIEDQQARLFAVEAELTARLPDGLPLFFKAFHHEYEDVVLRVQRDGDGPLISAVTFALPGDFDTPAVLEARQKLAKSVSFGPVKPANPMAGALRHVE